MHKIRTVAAIVAVAAVALTGVSTVAAAAGPDAKPLASPCCKN